MTAAWGPAFDAEIDYRHQRARMDFGRKLWRRKAQRSTTTHRTPRPQTAA